MPGGSKICEFAPTIDRNGIVDVTKCSLCGDKDSAHGWELGIEFDKHEIHRRSSLFKYKLKFGAEWEGRSLYNNVATGASITGFTRAHLLKAMCLVGRENVIYCDTDSIILKEGTDISKIPQSQALGDWELEDACAPIGHFVRKKTYGIKTSEIGKDGENVMKIASKGCKLFFDDMKDLLDGKTVTWKSPAPSFSITSGNIPNENMRNAPSDPLYNDKLFVVRNIRRTAK